jgi:acyl-CoA synthetase (AMP-forming)/AMP-acid ligase II
LLSECFVNSSTDIGALVAASSPDDIVLQYTGGTTGMPKGVIWRQDDLFVRALGGRNFRDGGREWGNINELTSSVETKPGPRLMPVCPFMHGTGLWTALQSLFAGGTVVMPHDTTRFDSHLVLEAIEAEKVVVLVLVGDAFFRPLIDELMKSDYKLESLRFIISSGAAISASNRDAVAKRLPHVKVKNVVGSSESGPQAEESETKDFSPRPGTVILAEDRLSVVSASDEQSGWLASCGHIPLGYLNDPAKSAAIFPVIDGQRYSVPGDRVKPLGGGRFQLLGRDSMVINTGGEKVFVEEVEEAIKAHLDVLDVLVVGRPSERWGNEIVAVVSSTGNTPSPEDLLEVAATRLARYKLPKDFVFVDKIHRSPSGKGDYRWAKSVVTSLGGQK